MQIVKFNHVNYDVNLLILHKGEGVTVNTTTSLCKTCDSTVTSEMVTRPIVVKQGEDLIILVDTRQDKKETFSVTLLSKHILKKAKIEDAVTSIRSQTQIRDAALEHQRKWNNNNNNNNNNRYQPGAY